MLSRLFIAALLSPEGKGLTSWLLFVMFIVILLLSHLVSWDRCSTDCIDSWSMLSFLLLFTVGQEVKSIYNSVVVHELELAKKRDQ